MLENDIRSAYLQMAAADQPASRVSIPVATRRGRARIRMHRAGAIGTPVFAAGAVLAIALTSAFPAGLVGTRRPSSAAQAPAPAYFNPLRPYVAFGWLPGSASTQTMGLYGRTEQLVYGPSPAILLDAYSAGHCRVRRHNLLCNAGDGQPQQIPDGHLGRKAGTVTGHQAYWMAASPIATLTPLAPSGTNTAEPFPSYTNTAGPAPTDTNTAGLYPSESPTAEPSSPGSSTQVQRHATVPTVAVPAKGGVSLKWQYARGGWAILTAPSLSTALRIARNVRFGPTAGPPISFPFQLISVPASWQVNSVATRWLDGVQYASSYLVTAGPVDGVPLGVYPKTTPLFDAGAGSADACAGLMYYKTTTRVINGYKVTIDHDVKFWPQYQLCASDANGVFVLINVGSRPAITPVQLFASHVRLLGPDPANWTTNPVG